MTGLALCGLAASLCAMVGIDVGIAATAAVVLAIVLLARLALARREPRLGSLRPPRQGTPGRVVELACLVLLGVLAVRVVGLAAASDLGWDGWAIWAAKAHALLVEGDVWGPVFGTPEYVMNHPEYPVLLPSLEALSAEAVGRFDPYLIDVEAAAVVVAFGLAVWGILRLVVPPAVAAGMGVALSGSAPLIENAAANYADAVVAAFVAVGLLGLLVWLMKGAFPPLVLAGVFLAAGAMTKTEGLVFALIGVVATLVVARGFGRPRTHALWLGVGVVALPLVWAVVDRLNGPGPRIFDASALLDPGYVAGAADRIPVATATMLGELGDAWAVASLAVVLALVAAAWARLWWPLLFVGLWAGLSFASLVSSRTSRAPSLRLAPRHLRRPGRLLDRPGPRDAAPVLVALAWQQVVTSPP